MLRHSLGAILLLCGIALCVSGCSHAPKASRRPIKYVEMRDRSQDLFAYMPARLTVSLGTRVIWQNRSSQPHSITPTGTRQAFDQTVAKQIDPGHEWSFVFKQAGKYDYYCVFHPYMKGVVVVR